MTVRELIKELEKCNPDGEVFTNSSGADPCSYVEDYCGDGETYEIG